MGKIVGMGYRPKKNKNIEKENKEKDILIETLNSEKEELVNKVAELEKQVSVLEEKNNEISTLISEKEDLIKKVSELEKKAKKSE